MHLDHFESPTTDKSLSQELIKQLETLQADGQKTRSDLENEQASRRRLQDEIKQLENLTVSVRRVATPLPLTASSVSTTPNLSLWCCSMRMPMITS